MENNRPSSVAVQFPSSEVSIKSTEMVTGSSVICFGGDVTLYLLSYYILTQSLRVDIVTYEVGIVPEGSDRLPKTLQQDGDRVGI